MKPIARKIKGDQVLAEELYHTGNYDAMYLAGIIADVKIMTEEDFNRWMEDAYFYMISDYIVAVTLSENGFAQEVSDRWIEKGKQYWCSNGIWRKKNLTHCQQLLKFKKQLIKADWDSNVNMLDVNLISGRKDTKDGRNVKI